MREVALHAHVEGVIVGRLVDRARGRQRAEAVVRPVIVDDLQEGRLLGIEIPQRECGNVVLPGRRSLGLERRAGQGRDGEGEDPHACSHAASSRAHLARSCSRSLPQKAKLFSSIERESQIPRTFAGL